MVDQQVELDCAAVIPGVGEERSAQAQRVTVSAAPATTTSSTTTTLAVSSAYEHDHPEYNEVGSIETDGEFSGSDDNLYEEKFTSGSLDKSVSAEEQEYDGQEGSLRSEIKKDFVPNEIESPDYEEK